MTKWQNPGVKMRTAAATLAGLAVLTLALFQVDFRFELSMPRNVEIPDPAVEALYDECYADRDHEIHAAAFGSIDNPEVQKEFINSGRVKAARECRELHPQALITVEEPLRFNLVDLKPRFW
jgi:hypothetical protein